MQEALEFIKQSPSLYLLSLLVIGYLFGIVVYQLTKKVIHRSFDIENSIIDQKLKTPLHVLFALVVAQVFFNVLQFNEHYLYFLKKLLFVFFVIAFAWVIARVINLVSLIVSNKFNTEKEDNLHERKVLTQFAYINKIVYFVLIVVAISIILLSFDEVRKVGMSLLASAGITGIIIGFAAQKTISNLLAGLQIAFTQPIRLDDVVIVENEWGRIEEITLTYVVVKIWDERRMVVPLSYFIEKPFQNWTKTKSDLLGAVTLWVDYTIPVDELREELRRLLDNTDLWDKRVEVLQVIETSEKSMQLRALMTAKDSPTAWDLRCYVREGLIKFIQENYPNSLPRLRLEKLEE